MLVELSYTFGDELGQYSGRLKARAELEVMAREHGEFSVYVVEVCTGCGWNHLVVSFVLGDGEPRTAGPTAACGGLTPGARWPAGSLAT